MTEHALDAERVRNARLMNLHRFLGVSSFLGMVLVVSRGLHRPEWEQQNWLVFLAYWSAAGIMLLAGRRSAWLARIAASAIPIVDMPAVFILQKNVLDRLPDAAPMVAGLSTGLYVLLVLGAVLLLDPRGVAIASVVGVAFAVALQRSASLDVGSQISAALVIMLTAALGTYIIHRTTRLVMDVRDEQQRRERFSRYFSPQVAAVLALDSTPTADAETRDVTVLFADLRHFTTLAEQLDSRRVVELLNDFHTRMLDAVFSFDGTLDKYLGDGLMAYFGAPIVQPDHPTRAVRTALAMQQALADLNAARSRRAEPPLTMAIGIHTGPVVVGDIGGPRRREYTVVGDTVNVAARLLELAKARDAPILVSASTRKLAEESFTFAGTVVVRGREKPLDVWAPAALHATGASMTS